MTDSSQHTVHHYSWGFPGFSEVKNDGKGAFDWNEAYPWWCGGELPTLCFFKPGTLSIQLKTAPGSYFEHVDDYEPDKNKAVDVGTAFTLTVEEPVINHNAPASIKTGSTVNFNTEFTNLNVPNHKVADYDISKNWHKQISWDDGEKIYIGTNSMIAYRPVVTVIEGKDIVTHSDQNYTNTLRTTETLKFNKVGTVKLKISYDQIVTCNICMGTNETYNPEKTITINVTVGGTPTNPPSSNTGNAPTQSNPQSTTPGSSDSETTSSETPLSSSADEQPVTIPNEKTGIKVGAQEGGYP